MNGKNHSYQIRDRKDPRDIANVILIGVNDSGKKSNVFLREILDKNADMEPKDKALTQRIVSTTLDHLFSIDALLDQYSKTPVDQLNPYIRSTLRTAVCQMFYMDRIPESAAINKAVELAKLHGLQGLSGYVNGVLRSIARQRNNKAGTAGEKLSNAKDGALRWSVPRWLYTKLVSDFGLKGAESLFASWLMLRKVSVRLNLSNGYTKQQILEMITSQGIHAEQVLDHPPVYELSGLSGIGVAGLEAFQKGLICVQDASAAMLTFYAPPEKGDHVLDLCAAPGGKTTAYADALDHTGLVIAQDVSDEKIKLIAENKERCGFDNIRIKKADATVFDKTMIEKSDVVVVDAPCSGLGVVAKKPDIKKNIQPESILSLQRIQRQILLNAIQYTKVGGRLVYSTCTITKEENEDNFDWILSQFPLKPLHKVRLQPDEHHDGFFIAVFQKTKQ